MYSFLLRARLNRYPRTGAGGIDNSSERPQTEVFESIPARGRPRATSRATGRPTGAKILFFYRFHLFLQCSSSRATILLCVYDSQIHQVL